MRYLSSMLKNVMVIQVIIAVFMLFLPLDSFAKAGCCSSHGGVAGCDAASGYQLCKDGTKSPTCKCDNSTTAKPAKTSKTTKVSKTPSTSTSAPAAAPAAVPAPAAAATTSKQSTKGCCAKHGGVGECDKATGYYKCKDGTVSKTCKCS